MINIYWENLISDIQSILVLNQSDFAIKCKVTQQTVSSWMSQTRIPRKTCREAIALLAIEANLSINDYSDAEHKRINISWRHLVCDLIKKLKLKQSDFAIKCKVTQQTISLWKSGKRSPNLYAQSVIKDFALKTKINLNDYEADLIKINRNRFPTTTEKFLLEYKEYSKQLQLDIRAEVEYIIGEKS